MLYCINSTTIVQVRCTHYKIIFWWWIELVPSLATLIIKLCREHYCLHVLYLSVYKMIIFTVASACLTLYRLKHHVIIKIIILISHQNTGIIEICKETRSLIYICWNCLKRKYNTHGYVAHCISQNTNENRINIKICYKPTHGKISSILNFMLYQPKHIVPMCTLQDRENIPSMLYQP